MGSTGNKYIDRLNEIIHDVDLTPKSGNRSPATPYSDMTSPIKGKKKGIGTKEHLEKLKELHDEQLREKSMRDAERRKKKELEKERKKNMENLPQTPAQHRDRVVNKLQDMHAAQDSSYKVMDDMLAKIDLHLATPKTREHTPAGKSSLGVETKDPGEFFNANTPVPTLAKSHKKKRW